MAEIIAIRPSLAVQDGIVRAGNWLARLLRRWRPRPARQLRLCESLPLGERRFLAVVEFGQQRFLIAGTGNSVALLAQLAPAAAQFVSESDSNRSHE